jgi:putative ABC transport system permease protein
VTAPPPAPPRALERGLERALAGERWRDAIVGDLAEEYSRRRGGGARFAGLWYAGEALRLALRFAPRHLEDRLWRRLTRRRPDSRKEPAMSQWKFDLRLSLRALAKRPAPTLLVVATLAIGLGANAAVYGLFDAMVLHPFSFFQSDRLIRLSETTPNGEFDRSNLSPANFLDYRAASEGVVEALVGFDWWDANLRRSEAPEKLQGFRVSTEHFDALRVRPAIGRFFLPTDGLPGAAPVVVLAHQVWQRQFGGDPAVVGRTLDIDGEAYTVVGVAPEKFAFPTGSEVWSPLVLADEVAARRDLHYLGAFGRLVDGVDLDAAAARYALVAERIAAGEPETMEDRGTATRSLAAGFRDVGVTPIFSLFQASALFVLMIGWINVANLVLARGQERQRELALLDALGAGRRRIVRLLLCESGILAAAAAVAALPIAALGQKLVRDMLPPSLIKFVVGWDAIGLDLRTLAVTFALAAVSLVAVAAWPALRASRPGTAMLLREGGRSGSAGVRRQRGRSSLVVAEIAAALALVVAATLAVRAAQRLGAGPQGYEPDRLVSFKLVLPEGRYAAAEARSAFAALALERLATLPGIESVAAANVLPATGENYGRVVAVEGEAEPNPAVAPHADLRTVSPGYFETLRLPIVAGRGLRPGDDAGATPVAVVSRSMAERYWPGREAVGQRFRAGDATEPWRTVVGVAGDHLHHWFSRRDAPTYFVPFAQQPRFGLTFAVRMRADRPLPAREVQAAMAEIDPAQPIFDLQTQRQRISDNTVGLRLVSGVMTVFAALALMLAVTGVYGVMAYRVSLRRQEFGVRMALGASAADVLRMTLGQSMRLAAIGLGIGLVASLAVARVVGSALRGASELDAGLVLGAALALAAATFVAAVLPARRALALDPADVLRAE